MKSVPYIASFLMLALVMACVQKNPSGKILGRINNYEIRSEEFEREFKDSIFGAQDTAGGRREFLNHLINQKLILQDAQERGLDKKREFLQAVENFWEQALLKVALEKKIKELSGSVSVAEQEVRALYTKRMETGIINATYEKAAPLLRREISRNKETQALSTWIDGLRAKAKITINEGLLK